MKKFLISFYALCAIVFAVSCTPDDNFAPANNTVVSVSFAAQLPQKMSAPRHADAEDNTITLSYAVYLAGTQTALFTSEDEVTFTNNEAHITLDLLKDQQYDILFWADCENAPYTFDFAEQTISIDYASVSCNDYTRDAFFGTVKRFKAGTGEPQNVTLKRPFAQLNIGATDIAEAAELGFAPEQTQVVTTTYPTLNLYTGNVEGEAAPITFALANIPTNQAFPVEPDSVSYLAMNYLLVDDKELIDIELIITDEAHSITHKYSNVPVERNCRTNMYGKLLTATDDFIISLDEDFDPMSPRKVSVMGDSYSTFKGYMPAGYYHYYPKTSQNSLTEVSQTWWYQLCDGEKYVLEINNSWSGSTISKTGYNGYDTTNRPFISDRRLGELGNPDIILLFGGTNDAWNELTIIGEYQYSDWTEEDLKNFRPAFAYLLSQLQTRYPNADLYYILNDEIPNDVPASIPVICTHYNVPIIALQDIEKESNHPSPAGMTAICGQVKAFLAGETYIPPTQEENPAEE